VLPMVPWTSMKCIVTDDTPLNVFVLQQKLHRKGAQVLTSGNGQQCIDQYLASPSPVDFILMDIWMPVMDGLEATKELRTRGVTVPIIGLTADYTTGIAKQALEAGMTEVLLKPISWTALERVLSKLPLPKYSRTREHLPVLEADSTDAHIEHPQVPGTVLNTVLNTG
jgi:CheY-like chemotaxis protein